jgi:hypothetical protein
MAESQVHLQTARPSYPPLNVSVAHWLCVAEPIHTEHLKLVGTPQQTSRPHRQLSVGL